MGQPRYQKLTEVNGRGQGEMLESYMEVHGITVELVQEAYTQAWYASAVNTVQVFVPNDQVKKAQALLKEFDERM